MDIDQYSTSSGQAEHKMQRTFRPWIDIPKWLAVLLLGEWSLILIMLAVPCSDCLTGVTPFQDSRPSLLILGYAVLLGPLLESCVLFVAIFLLRKVIKKRYAIVVVSGVVFGLLHIDQGSARFVVTAFAFGVYTLSYLRFPEQQCKRPFFWMNLLHVLNNFVASIPMIVEMVRAA